MIPAAADNKHSQDVLVVGAGPVGLVAACELARQGARVRLIDLLDDAGQKLAAMRDLTARRTSIHLGMPDLRPCAGRCSPDS